MKNKDLNQKINKAFTNTTPDLRESILQNAGTASDNIVAMPRRRSAVRWVAGIAAALVLVTGLVAGGVFYQNRNTAVSTVSLDVNPSVSITLNREERVLAVEAKNEEGRRVIGDMDFKGSDLDVAINALIGSMLRNGYLSEVANSILLSVDNPDPTKGADLQNRLTTAINELLQTNTFSGAVLSQTLSPDEELQKLADTHGISRGKAQLIRQITSQNTLHTFEELAPLSINELNLISESGGLHLENVQAVGTASNQAYIGEQKALEKATAHAGVPAGEATRVKWEMDYERGKMVYEIDFDHSDYEYEYDIDATTGEVVKSEREPKRQRPATNSTTTNNSTAGNNTTTAAPPAEPGKDIGEEAAKSAALTHAGVAEKDVLQYTGKKDRDDGRTVYEIEFFTTAYTY
ncbi:MAG: PepSY domain-containing protein, partial [Clostridia bacterium]|nr:PepSY domain-containing protein [Clostridia bacterium]